MRLEVQQAIQVYHRLLGEPSGWWKQAPNPALEDWELAAMVFHWEGGSSAPRRSDAYNYVLHSVRAKYEHYRRLRPDLSNEEALGNWLGQYNAFYQAAYKENLYRQLLTPPPDYVLEDVQAQRFCLDCPYTRAADYGGLAVQQYVDSSHFAQTARTGEIFRNLALRGPQPNEYFYKAAFVREGHYLFFMTRAQFDQMLALQCAEKPDFYLCR